MTVHFFEPSAGHKAGGLELAIRSLEAFLTSQGTTVTSNPDATALDRSGGPQVAHFHGIWQPAFARISARCRRLGIPYVVSPHGMLEPWAWRQKRWKKWPWFHLVERRHLAGAVKLHATAEREAENLRAFPTLPPSVAIPLGLTSNQRPDYHPARRTLGWGDRELVCLFLSRIHQKKGLSLLLEAMTALTPADRARLRLVIVGAGADAYLAEVRSTIERWRDRLPRIDWIGEVSGDPKWPYFQGADLFCLPSHSENFGLAVLEALQVGTRVLTTTQTPWTMVPHWNAGYLVEPAADSVRAGLEQFLAQPAWPLERREALAQQIRERFSWDAVGPAYLRFYDDVIGITP